MNIRLFRICAVPIRISSPEFHVSGTCFFMIWGARSHYVPFMNGIVWGGTWTPRATYVDHSYFCALVGARIYTCPYVSTQLKVHVYILGGYVSTTYP